MQYLINWFVKIINLLSIHMISPPQLWVAADAPDDLYSTVAISVAHCKSFSLTKLPSQDTHALIRASTDSFPMKYCLRGYVSWEVEFCDVNESGLIRSIGLSPGVSVFCSQ